MLLTLSSVATPLLRGDDDAGVLTLDDVVAVVDVVVDNELADELSGESRERVADAVSDCFSQAIACGNVKRVKRNDKAKKGGAPDRVRQ